MPVSHDDTPLELLIAQRDGGPSAPIVLLPHALGSGSDAIARSLFETLETGRWRLLPAPNLGPDVVAQRAWHRDLWLGMPTADRDSVALVSGATAGFLGPVLADAARTVAFVRDPVAGVRAITGALPKRRTLERLAETPTDEVPPRLRRIANPQSRALLAPWHDPAELLVSAGPPGDADRWREALFGEALPHIDAAAAEQAPGVAHDLARSLGGRPKPVAQAAKALVDHEVHAAEKPEQVELLLSFNWLDAELYDRCLGMSREAS